MQETTLKFNRGDVAEGILGATLVAKFINRPKNLNDSNVVVTKKMINDVLDDFFKKSSSVSYNVKDIVSKKGRFAVDNIKFGMSLPLPAFTLLQQSNQRNVVVVKFLCTICRDFRSRLIRSLNHLKKQ